MYTYNLKFLVFIYLFIVNPLILKIFKLKLFIILNNYQNMNYTLVFFFNFYNIIIYKYFFFNYLNFLLNLMNIIFLNVYIINTINIINFIHEYIYIYVYNYFIKFNNNIICNSNWYKFSFKTINNISIFMLLFCVYYYIHKTIKFFRI